MASTSPPTMRIQHLADFKPPASTRAWSSIPNPNNLPLIATATSDKTVRVYSLNNFTLHSTLEGGHERSVRSAAWKPGVRKDGALTLATGSFDATMGIWRRNEEQKNTTGGGAMELEIGADGTANKGPQLRSGGDEGDDEEEGDDWEFSIVLEGHDSEIKNVAYSPSGQWLASCSRDKTIWIWEEIGEEGEDEFETVAVLQDHNADIKCICWRKDDGNGEVLASGSYDDQILLSREDGEGDWTTVATLDGHEGTVWSLDWEPDVCTKSDSSDDSSVEPPTPRLLSSSADMTIRVWSKVPTPPPQNKPSYFNPGIPSTMRPGPEHETWECTATLPKVHDLPIYSINWSKQSGRVVSTGGDGRVAIYEERTKGRSSVGGTIEKEWVVLTVLESAHGPYEINHATWCMRFDSGKKRPDEEMIITTGDDGLTKAWSIEENLEENKIDA